MLGEKAKSPPSQRGVPLKNVQAPRSLDILKETMLKGTWGLDILKRNLARELGGRRRTSGTSRRNSGLGHLTASSLPRLPKTRAEFRTAFWRLYVAKTAVGAPGRHGSNFVEEIETMSSIFGARMSLQPRAAVVRLRRLASTLGCNLAVPSGLPGSGARRLVKGPPINAGEALLQTAKPDFRPHVSGRRAARRPDERRNPVLQSVAKTLDPGLRRGDGEAPI